MWFGEDIEDGFTVSYLQISLLEKKLIDSCLTLKFKAHLMGLLKGRPFFTSSYGNEFLIGSFELKLQQLLNFRL